MEFGNEKEKNNLKKEENKIEYEIKTETTTQNTQLNEMLPKLVKRIKSGNKSNLYIDTDTAETNTHLNRNNSALERNKSYDELSFISRETEKKENKKKEKINLRSLKFFKNNAEIEKELLKGIKLETPKEEINTVKKFQTKAVLKTEGQLYKENLELLKLVNKRQYEIQKQREEYDLFILKKKLGNKKNLSLVMNNKN
jgi:hypothetical protein